MTSYKFSWKLPLFLYAVTWLTTTGIRIDGPLLSHLFLSAFGVETTQTLFETLKMGLSFSLPLMFLLTCHELGHYVQTRRYAVPASLPYFIPIPFGPFGTLGAVIAMDGRIPNRRALFDIGISGPIAGLVPTLIFLYYGIQWSYVVPASTDSDMIFGEPLLLQWMIAGIHGPLPPDLDIMLHPVAMAGWVGLFLTSLNLMPVSQLDGGHVFYALLGKRAGVAALGVFYLAIILVALFRLWHWTLMLLILAMIGVAHPPTANDAVPLTSFRHLLGWSVLAFILIGFTPTPIQINEPTPRQKNEPQWFCRVEGGESAEANLERTPFRAPRNIPLQSRDLWSRY